MQEGHGFGEGEFGLFEGVEVGGDGIVHGAGEVCAGEIRMQEAAVGEVCISAVRMTEIGFLEGDVFGDAPGKGDIFQGQSHKG